MLTQQYIFMPSEIKISFKGILKKEVKSYLNSVVISKIW